MADKFKDKAQQVIKRREKSLDHWKAVDEECAEVHQAMQCRTNPIYKLDKNGKETSEIDDTKTNVAMPIMSIMVRKNVSRMTANPPDMKFISKDKAAGEKLSGWHTWQYDVTNEAETRRKTVLQAEAFGAGVEKLYQDDVVVRRKLRVPTQHANRRQLLSYRGAEDIDEQVRQLGEALAPEEIQAALMEIGPEFMYEEVTKKYSYPVSKSIFIGDLHLPPGCDNLDTAEWIIEDFVESEVWLEAMATKAYDAPDPHSGGTVKVPVMNAEAVEKMMAEDRDLPQDEKDSLRKRFRAISGLDDASQHDKELRCSKKFQIYEQHYKKDGKNWICWVGNGTHYLGEMPYPWDFYGQWAYTALVPLPNLVSWIGDSTPRLGRYLYRLLNVNVGQRQDLISEFMQPMVFMRQGVDAPEEALRRRGFKVVQMPQGAGDYQVERQPQIPQYAWEQEAALLRAFGMLDPALMSADMAGTNANPQQGKTATVGVLAQRERDSLLQFKVDGMNVFLKKHGQKKLWMLQQTLNETLAMGPQYFSKEFTEEHAAPEAISSRYGQAAVITLDWPEIQEDIQVEPKAGSTLSIEDEFHRMSAQTLFQMAQSAPDVIDQRYAATVYVGTMPGVDANKAIKPESPPPDPMSAVKMSLNVSMPLDKMTPDITNQALEKMGFTASEELANRGMLEGIVKVGEAADAAGRLAEPAGGEPGGNTGQPEKAGIRRTLADRA